MNEQGICLNCGQHLCQNTYEKKDNRLNCYSQCLSCGCYMTHWKYESFNESYEIESDCDPGIFIFKGEYWYDFILANIEGKLITELDVKYEVKNLKNCTYNRRKEHQQYLKTSEWKDMRLKVLKRDDYTCQGCLENPATEVHHITYDNWKNEFMFELMSLCRECHSRFHKKDKQ